MREGVGFDLGRGALADEFAFVDDDDAAGEGVGFFEVVGGEEDGFAVGGQGADLGPEGAAGFYVEADGGLVEEDEVGVAGEGEGEEDTLFLAAGELTKEAVFEAFEVGEADEFARGEGAGVVAAEEVDVLADAEGFWGAADLEHDAGAEAVGAEARVLAEDVGLAVGGGAEAEEELDGGGFAGAVGAEEGDYFAGVEG